MVKRILIGCMLASSTAHANPQQAAELFERGRVQKEQGDLAGACKSFERSYRLERAAGTALNLAECEERAGNWDYALDLYDGAAQVFSDSDREESAEFARQRAARLRAAQAAKREAPTRMPLPETEDKSKWALWVGIGGLSLGAISMGIVVHAYGVMNDFSEARIPPGETVTPSRTAVTEKDCGAVMFSSSEVQDKFEASCAARQRVRWLAPTALASTVVGVGALVYYVVSKPKKRSSIAITPTTSGGVVATFEW